MDRFTYAVVGGVLALVVVGLVAAGVSRGRQAPPDLSTPAGVTLAYALAEQRGDGAAAWDLLAPSVQAKVDRDRFLAHVGTQSSSSEYLTTEDERVDADGASVALVHTYAAAGGFPFLNLGGSASSIRTTVRLTPAPGGWRITVPPDAYILSDRF